MKTKFFRNNAFVKASALVSRCLGKLGMTVVGKTTATAYCYCLLLLLLCPVVLAAQNGVTVSNLNVEAGTVTFNVSWDKDAPNMPEVWSDTVWVFVDYNAGGVMERLPLTGATLTNPSWEAASITRPNDQGARVVGNARTANDGSFSATVQLLTATANFSGACVYASNYPPVAEYVDGKIKFTGTPNYKIVFEGTSGKFNGISDGTYTRVAGETIDTFTDKTGAPGIIKCLPSTVYELAASAAGFCPGDSVTFALSNVASGRVYRLYRGDEAVDALTDGQDAAATFTGTFAGAGTYTARVDADGTHCAAAMNGTHTITANALPTAPTITKPADVCYNGDALVFEATGYSGALTWTAVTSDGSKNGDFVTYASGAATGTKTVTARASQTFTGAPACLSAEATQTGTINALPTVNGYTGASRCGDGTVTLSATPSSDAAIEWYEVSTEGWPLHTGNPFTPDVTATKTYYAQAKHSTTNCVSALPRTAVLATVIAYPSISTQPVADTSVCSGSTVSLTVVANPATAYQWKKDGVNVTNGTGGTAATYTTAAVTANATYTVVVGNAGACSTTSDNALVSVKTTGCYDTIDQSSCTGTINFTYISKMKSEGSMNWSTAITFCNSKGSGWRLPTQTELLCICSMKGQLIGYNESEYYWSSSHHYGINYWNVQFPTCSDDSHFDSVEHAVKCVK